MPVISCPDCGRDVSTLAPVCPHCGRPSPAGTAPIAPSAVKPMKEETLWQGRPSWATLAGKLVLMLLIVILIPLVARFFASRAFDLDAASRIMKIGWLVTLLALAYEAITFLVALLRIRSTLYTITSQRVMVESGLLSKQLSEIDLRYIDDTNFYQSVVARFLGIGNVTLLSSDKSSPTYVLRNIKDPRGVRELIRANAYQVSQRQIFTRTT
jgi:membrane protein YdbS with pleckstrin-like domain